MKPLRIVEIALLLLALLALIVMYFAFREHFPWLLAGYGLGVLSGVVATILITRGLRKKKD